MIQLTLVDPEGGELVVAIEDDALVFDGYKYVRPEHASYATVYEGPILSPTREFYISPMNVYTSFERRLRVLNVEPAGVGPFDPLDVVTAVDPSDGECICLLTCRGTQLSYVVVGYDPALPPFTPPDKIPIPGTPSGGGDSDCTCSERPCCSPFPEWATHIRCATYSLPWFYALF